MAQAGETGSLLFSRESAGPSDLRSALNSFVLCSLVPWCLVEAAQRADSDLVICECPVLSIMPGTCFIDVG